MKLFTTNQNNPERVLRFILSLILIPAPIVYEYDPYSIVLAIVGGILLFQCNFRYVRYLPFFWR